MRAPTLAIPKVGKIGSFVAQDFRCQARRQSAAMQARALAYAMPLQGMATMHGDEKTRHKELVVAEQLLC